MTNKYKNNFLEKVISNKTKVKILIHSIFYILFCFLLILILPYNILSIIDSFFKFIPILFALLVIILDLQKKSKDKVINFIIMIITFATMVLSLFIENRSKYIEPIYSAEAVFDITVDRRMIFHRDRSEAKIDLVSNGDRISLMSSHEYRVTSIDSFLCSVHIEFKIDPNIPTNLIVGALEESNNIIFCMNMLNSDAIIEHGKCNLIINGKPFKIIKIPKQIAELGVYLFSDPGIKPFIKNKERILGGMYLK